MIRDALLGLEAAAIQNWYYTPAVLLAALVGGFLAHRLVQGHLSYLLARALAVGLLITIGVHDKLFGRLPDSTWVYPGHRADTTLGAERPHLDEWRGRGW